MNFNIRHSLFVSQYLDEVANNLEYRSKFPLQGDRGFMEPQYTYESAMTIPIPGVA